MTHHDMDIRPMSAPDGIPPGEPQSTSSIDTTLRLILAQMPIVIWATDADLRFTLSGGGGLVGLGIGPAEVVGQDLFQYFGTDDPDFPPIAAHRRALAGHPQAFDIEWGGRTFLNHVEPLRTGGAEIHGVVGLAIDITARVETERELEATVRSLRETDRMRHDLLGRLMHAEEQERRRIALDVHDGPIQEMVALGLRLHMLRERVDDPETADGLAHIADALGSTARGLRALAFELVPPSLEREGLAVALGELLAQVEERSGIAVGLQDELEAQPPTAVSTLCFRIVQEAVSNVRKHARARRLSVVLSSADGGISVTVRDDGIGFDPSAPPEAGHLGLAAMRQRAHSAGGRLRIDSTPGAGTSVELWLPLAM